LSKTRILCFAAILTAISAPASTLTFTVNQDACTGTCGTAPFATITLVDKGTGTSAFVSVTETLDANERFGCMGAGDALEFSVTEPITIGNIAPGFAIGPAPDSASAFGWFLESVTCTACVGGQPDNPVGPLSFTVGSPTGVTTASFLVNTNGYYFSSDIVGNNGNTGNVAAMGPDPGPSTPEPGSILLAMSGFAFIGAGLIRKKA
jgi:hypothetical protein